MKRIFALIIAMLMLAGCGRIPGNKNDNHQEDENNHQGNESIENLPTEDGEDTPSNKNNENNDDENENKNEDDNAQNGENGDNAGESIQKITLNEYIKDLSDSEYCGDADFLYFVASMDERAVGNIIYAAPNGSGDGDIKDPASIEDAIDMANPGDTIYLRGGEYVFKEAIWLSSGGKAGAYITIKSYPGESAKLTTTPENMNKYDDNGEYLFFAFDAGVSYVIFEDLEIYGATYKYVAAFACYDGGQNHLIFKNIKIHDIGTSKTEYGCNAFLFLGEKKEPINNIMLIDNECYNLTLGYSEAISFAGNCEYCYVVGNRVYDCTNIGVDFYGNAEYCSVESLDQARYCVAAYNTVYNCSSPYADCAGIYVDGGKNCLIEGNYVYGCQYGIEIGSEELKERYPVTDIIVRNNLLKENSVCAMRIGGYDTKTSGTVKNTYVYNNSFVDNRGNNIIISKADKIVFANNIFISNNTYVETEFSESYIKNLEFYNNRFDREGDTFALYGNDIDISKLNARYGGDNFVSKTNLDDEFCPDSQFVGHKDYSPKYDFYLHIREKYYIGAVEGRAE